MRGIRAAPSIYDSFFFDTAVKTWVQIPTASDMLSAIIHKTRLDFSQCHSWPGGLSASACLITLSLDADIYEVCTRFCPALSPQAYRQRIQALDPADVAALDHLCCSPLTTHDPFRILHRDAVCARCDKVRCHESGASE